MKRGLASGFPRSQNYEVHIYTLSSFRSFTSRDFGTGKYKKLSFRYPGCRNTKTPYHIHAIIISGFHTSGFWDWKLQEILPLGISGDETPKHQDSNHATLFQGFASRDFRTDEYKGFAFKYHRCRNTET